MADNSGNEVTFSNGTQPLDQAYSTNAPENLQLRRRKKSVENQLSSIIDKEPIENDPNFPPARNRRRRTQQVDAGELEQIMHILTPLYKRKIFYEQLKSKWYVIVIPILLIVIASIVIPIIIIPMLSSNVTVVVYPPVHPILVEWKIQKFNDVHIKDISLLQSSNETKDKAQFTMFQNAMSEVYEDAELPVETVTVIDFKEIESDFTSTLIGVHEMLVKHTVDLIQNETILENYDLNLHRAVKRVRRNLMNNSLWLLDPGHIKMSREDVTSQSSSLERFLSLENPPVDLLGKLVTDMPISTVQSRSLANNFTTKLQCKSFVLPANVTVSPDSCIRQGKIVNGMSCEFSCTDKSLTLVGSNVRTCLNIGIWSGSEVTCERKCSILPPLANGMISPEFCFKENVNVSLLPSTRCRYLCDTGFELHGSFSRQCTKQGTWSGAIPICKKTCPGRVAPAGGHVVPSDCAAPTVTEGFMCTFYCNPDYILHGEITSTCDSSGKWTADPPVCRRKCNDLRPLKFGDVHPNSCIGGNVYDGITCTFTCDNGFKLIGHDTTVCQVNGTWSKAEPTCVKLCNQILPTANVIITPKNCYQKNSISGDLCNFECEAGFVLDNKKQILCQNDGTWNNNIPKCIAQCPALDEPPFGNLICSGNEEEDSCALVCKDGYRLHGSNFVVCQKDGAWSEKLGVCISICPKLFPPPNGYIVPLKCSVESSIVGIECEYNCEDGYGIRGEMYTYCRENGTWSDNSTICKKEEQYMIRYEFNNNIICLFGDLTAQLAIKEDWVECMANLKSSTWSIYKDSMIRNARSGQCIQAEYIGNMARLTTRTCNESSAGQHWEWPENAYQQYVIKLKDYDLYPWEGYTSITETVLTDRVKQATQWLVLKRTSGECSFYGAAKQGSCPILNPIENGRWSPAACSSMPSKHKNYCTFICDYGYEVGERHTENRCNCGKWTMTTVPKCVKSCKGLEIGLLKNGTILPEVCYSSYYVARGTSCSVTCAEGFQLIGESGMVCLNSGKWSRPLPQCMKVCPSLGMISNGYVHTAVNCHDPMHSSLPGSQCTFSCNEMFALVGTNTLKCHESGVWSDIKPECKRICSWENIPNAVATCSNSAVNGGYISGTTCTVTCLPSFVISPSNSSLLTCLDNGLWDLNQPVCKKLCSALNPLTNGFISPPECTANDVAQGETCIATCNTPYSMQGTSVRQCMTTGQWSGADAICNIDTHFLLWHSDGINKNCLVAFYYSFHKVYQLKLLQYDQCDPNNKMHLWTKSLSAYILRHVGTNWCLESTDGISVQLTDCDFGKMEQQWECQLIDGKYVVKSSEYEKYIFVHNQDNQFFSIQLNSYITDQQDAFNWLATDFSSNTGSVCGMTHGGNAACPKMILQNNIDLTPNTCNLLVSIGDSCTVTCPAGFVLDTLTSSVASDCNSYGVWSVTDLKCKKRFCEATILPENSSVNDPDCVNTITDINDSKECTFTCNVGSKVIKETTDTGSLRCLPSGEWSEKVISCPKICPALLSPANGRVFPESCLHSDRSIENMICNFTCNPNYLLTGKNTLTCIDGSWDNSSPICALLTGPGGCPGLSAPENGQLVPPTCYGTAASGLECRVSCIAGYSVLEESNLICQANGAWSADLPKCERICYGLSPPDLGSVTPERCLSNNNTVGDDCTFLCQKNFKILSNRISTCKADGTWSDNEAVCVKELQFLIRSNKHKTCLQGNNDGKVTYASCDFESFSQRWAWVGRSHIRNVLSDLCLEASSPEPFVPIILKECISSDSLSQQWKCPIEDTYKTELHSALDTIKMSMLSVNYNKIFTVPKTSFDVDESNFTALNETHQGSICMFQENAACPMLSNPENGYVDSKCQGSSAIIHSGKSCLFNCNNGYSIVGPAEITCGDDGIWDVTEKTTCEKMCGVMTSPDYGNVTPSSCIESNSLPGTVCNITCQKGFMQAGTSLRTCNKFGEWTGLEPVCHAPCPSVGDQQNTLVYPKSCAIDSQVAGISCTTSCNTGFVLKGNSVQTCNKLGEWSSAQGKCLRTCSPLSSVNMGSIQPSDCLNPGKMVGDTCTYRCQKRYGLPGSGVRVCLEDGTWSGKEVACYRSCNELYPIPNGFLSCSNSILLAGVSCTYDCKPGYVLDGVQSRFCSNSGEWSDDTPRCVQEKQFLLQQSSPPNPVICLIYNSATDSIKLINHAECDYANSHHRWAWFTENQIRNVYSRKCLQASNFNTGSYLTLNECNLGESLQHWECLDGQSTGFFRLVEPQLYPLVSSMSTYRVLLFEIEDLRYVQESSVVIATHAQWYAKTNNINSTSVCSSRKATVCGALTHGEHLSVEPSSCELSTVSAGVECKFSCDESTIIKESYKSIKCLNSGYWTKPPPHCVPSCISFTTKSSTVLIHPKLCSNAQSVAEGQVCHFSCPHNGKIVGSPLSTCMANGKWSDPVPECLSTCPALNEPHHGYMVPNKCTTVGTRLLQGFQCTYKCYQDEHEVSRSKVRECTSSGQWTGYNSDCVKPCSALTPVVGAVASPAKCIEETSLEGTMCSFQCSIDLLPAEPQLRVCQQNSTWSNKKAFCETPCEHFQYDNTSAIIYYPSGCTQKKLLPGSQCSIKCIPEYDTVGNDKVTCLENGNWDKPFGICARKCPRLDQPKFGLLTPSSCLGSHIYEGITCTVTCQPGYMVKGSDTRVCLKNGNWTGNAANCIRSCPNILDVFDGELIPRSCKTLSQEQGSTCTAKCPLEQVLLNGKTSMEIVCQSDGTWSGDIPDKCYQTCPRPKYVNSQVICRNVFGQSTHVFAENTVCDVLCNLKYAPSSPPQSKCTLNIETNEVEWVPLIAECIYAPDPMVVIQRVGFDSSCMGIDQNDNAEMMSWHDCTTNAPTIRWIWRYSNHILNTKTGLCLTAASEFPDEPIVLATCDIENDLQMWDCDKSNPFFVKLLNSDMGPCSGYDDYNLLTLQPYNGPNSLFYTYNPLTDDEIGTLCSRQPTAKCPGLVLNYATDVLQPECMLDDVFSNTICQLYCIDSSYAVVGPSIITCSESGEWLPALNSQCIKTCPPLEELSVPFTLTNCSNNRQLTGTECRIECPSNQTKKENSIASATCLSSGTWSALPNATCHANCPIKEPIENGYFVPAECYTGTCVLECNKGYRLQGFKYIQCLETGQWENKDYACVEDTQFYILTNIKPLMKDMCLTVYSKNIVSKQLCKYGTKSQLWRWHSHYTLQNIATDLCLTKTKELLDGRSLLLNATDDNDMIIYFRNSTLQSDVFVTDCNGDNKLNFWECGGPENYFAIWNKHTGESMDQGPQFASRVILSSTIGQTQKWFSKDYIGTRTTCSHRPSGVCPSIPSIYGGLVYPTVCQSDFIVAGTKCFFKCNQKFTIEGADTVTCQENGLWTDNFPNCLGIGRCSQVTLSKGLKVQPPSCGTSMSSEGQICKFTCRNDQYLVGNSTVQCLTSKGKWSNNFPNCRFKCPPLPAPLNGTIEPDTCQHYINHVGTKCNFTCDEKYEMIGSDSRICLEGGQWSHEATICRKMCLPFEVSIQAVVEPETCTTNKSREGQTCKVSCKSGFSLSSKSLISCRNGAWSGYIPICLPHHCLRYDSEIEGISQIVYSHTKNGAIVRGSIMEATCEKEYKLVAGSKKVCLKEGIWSGKPKICTKIKCPALNRLYHGSITPLDCSSKMVDVGETCSYSCDDGYTMVGPSLIECWTGGIWSVKDVTECHDTHITIHHINFLLASKEEDVALEDSMCLGIVGALKLSSLKCDPPTPYIMWRWFGSHRLQNIANQFCLTVANATKDSPSIALQKCDLNNTLQEIKCGDIDSIPSMLHLQVGNFYMSQSLKTFSFGQNVSTSIDWAATAMSVMPKKYMNSKGSKIQEYEFPACTYMCGGNYSELSGNIASPNYPGVYPSDVICQWLIDIPGKILTIYFSRITLGDSIIEDKFSSDCRNDYLLVTEGGSSNLNIDDRLVLVCGESPAMHLKTLHGRFHIETYSDHDASDNKHGFAATWITEDLPVPKTECGISEQLLFSDSQRNVVKYPWHAAIITKNKICDGVFITTQIILTSAHCLDHVSDANSMRLVQVAHDFTSQAQLLYLKKRRDLDFPRKIWLHKHYNTDWLKHDVALILLNGGVLKDNSTIGDVNTTTSICFSNVPEKVALPGNQNCTVVGFDGSVLKKRNPNWVYTVAEKVELLSERQCRHYLYERKGISSSDGFICTQGIEEHGQSSKHINNDGGSILQCPWNGNFYAIGIASFELSADNHKVQRIRVFTSLHAERKWIQSTMDDAFFEPSNIF